MLDIVGIGSPILDIVKINDKIYKRVGGGTLNTILTLQKLGLRTGFVGRFGNDKFGKKILKTLIKEKIDVSRARLDKKFPTTTQYIRIVNDQSELVKTKNLKSMSKLSKLDLDYFKNSASLFVGLRNQTINQCINFANRYDKRLFISLHRNFNVDRLGILKKSKAKIIFSNEDEFSMIPNQILKQVLANKTILVITKGDKGSSLYFKDMIKDYPAFKVKSKDVTIAGDIFAGAFIYGYLRKWNLDKTCLFSNTMGALATTKINTLDKIRVEKAFELLTSG